MIIKVETVRADTGLRRKWEIDAQNVEQVLSILDEVFKTTVVTPPGSALAVVQTTKKGKQNGH